MKTLTILFVLPLIALLTMGNSERSLTTGCIAAYGALFGAYSTRPQSAGMKRVYGLRQKICICFIANLMQRREMNAPARKWLADTFKIMKSGSWKRSTARQKAMPRRLLQVIPPTSHDCNRRILRSKRAQ